MGTCSVLHKEHIIVAYYVLLVRLLVSDYIGHNFLAHHLAVNVTPLLYNIAFSVVFSSLVLLYKYKRALCM